MGKTHRKGVAHELRRTLLEVAAFVRGNLASLRASAWGAPLGRAVLVSVGLVVLAAVGRAAGAAAIAAVPAAEDRIDGSVREGDAGGPPTPESHALPPGTAETVPRRTTPETTPCSRTASDSRASPEAPVVLNTATLEELRRLPGVGAKRGEAILALRQKLGRFRQVEDLLRVKGVGRATLKKWRSAIRLDP